mmetsp:Transcript_33134/g.98598  ORF Transcript_33134/g.98598 Transcript_33134/m.98598 type:complete len:215 (-) Transcript_33134:131-775(-)
MMTGTASKMERSNVRCCIGLMTSSRTSTPNQARLRRGCAVRLAHACSSSAGTASHAATRVPPEPPCGMMTRLVVPSVMRTARTKPDSMDPPTRSSAPSFGPDATSPTVARGIMSGSEKGAPSCGTGAGGGCIKLRAKSERSWWRGAPPGSSFFMGERSLCDPRCTGATPASRTISSSHSSFSRAPGSEPSAAHTWTHCTGPWSLSAETVSNQPS